MKGFITKQFLLFILFICAIIAVVSLGGCAMAVQNEYEGADGKTYRMVNSTIVMPFSKSSTHTTVAEKIDELNYQLTDKGELTYQDGWVPEVGSTLGGAALFSAGLSDSASVIDNTSNNISTSTSESLGGSVDMDFMYKPKHKYHRYDY